HSLQGVPAPQACPEPGPIQFEVSSEADQRGVRVISRGPLLHLFKQPMVHGPELPLIPGTFRRRSGHRGTRMDPQWELLCYPQHVSGLDESLVENRLRRQGVTLAERALEICELYNHELGVRVSLVGISRDRKAWALRVRGQTLRFCPERQLRLLGFGLWRLLAGQQRVDPSNENFYGLSPGQRVSFAARLLYELERGGPVETQCLRRRHTLLHPRIVTARSHAPLIGRHIGPHLAGGRGQEGGRIR